MDGWMDGWMKGWRDGGGGEEGGEEEQTEEEMVGGERGGEEKLEVDVSRISVLKRLHYSKQQSFEILLLLKTSCL